ncbi:MAG: MFS transporter [Cephaloticoccus sp.]|nr:MFS transporter [Cephaloticoccus sp.]MCF7761929.1 MFS transporter [Cephaloticoccus sp.]
MPSSSRPAVQRSVWIFALLYFSEGAPIGFLWWAMPTLLRAEGVAVERITMLTALLVLPWTGKFLWAPLVDAMRSVRWGFRHWAISAQLAMGACLVPLLWFDPAEHLSIWITFLFAHAFFAATQDVAIDALAVTTTAPEQRGWLNGAMQAGMLLGRSLFGGGAILLAHHFGWHAVLLALLLAIWCSVLFLWNAALGSEPVALHESARVQFAHSIRSAIASRNTWMGLGFALTAGAGFEALGALAGPFLVDAGVAVDVTGVFFGLPVVMAMLVGGLAGGKLADRGDRRRTVASYLGLLCLLVASVGVAYLTGLPSPVLMGLMVLVYIAIGLFTAASYALFMDLTDPRLGATQFSTFMAATNGCEAWAAWTGGRIVGTLGYGAAFLIMPVIALTGLFFLRSLTKNASK